VKKLKILKGACLFVAASMLPLSQAAIADTGNWTISGWINQGVTWIDDGVGSDIITNADNGNTLGSRITLGGSHDLPNSGLNAGFDVVIEMLEGGQLGIGTGADSNIGGFDAWKGMILSLLSHNVFIGGAWGKLTVGLQSMPTDNIAVLEDPSLTLWSSISPVFRGNGVFLQNTDSSGNQGSGATGQTGFTGVRTNSTWGDFMNCYTAPHLRHSLGIGIDCNGTYQEGIRYDLPAFGPVTIAIGYADDDVYDIAAKWKGSLGRIKANVALGYAINQGVEGVTFQLDAADLWEEAENFQIQAGLMDPESGLFGSIAYQHEEADLTSSGKSIGLQDDTDAFWLKVGIKRDFNSYGPTTLAFQYGQYNDQYGTVEASNGIRDSELERIGVEVNQYFGSRLILYGVWENLSVDVECLSASDSDCRAINGADDLDTFTAGFTYFF